MLNRLWLWLGERGWLRHEGLRGYEPKWWPRAYVEYHDTEKFGASSYNGYRFTCDMAVGNAWDYARVFDGTVHLKGTGPRDENYNSKAVGYE